MKHAKIFYSTIILLFICISNANALQYYDAYENCESNCGGLSEAFGGLLIIGGASIAVFVLRLFSDKFAFFVLEGSIAYLSYFVASKLGGGFGVFGGVLSFIGLQFWVMLLWALSEHIKKH